MYTVYKFFIRHLFLIVFLILEIISSFLIVKYNGAQRTFFLNTTQSAVSGINTQVYQLESYLNLKQENEILLKENARLRNLLSSNYKRNTVESLWYSDSVFQQQYAYIPAQVIYSEVSKSNNYLNINVGERQGIEKGDAVVSSKGIVGVVREVSEHFALVIPVINTLFKGSGRIIPNGYYGSVVWEPTDYRIAQLNDIPTNCFIHQGDSVLTSGFSHLFPTGVLIGVIDEFKEQKGEPFYDIKVRLAVDFKNIQNVYVVKHLLKTDLSQMLQ